MSIAVTQKLFEHSLGGDLAEGIVRLINHALVELSHKAHPEKDLQKYIGSHLNITLSELMGIQDKVIVFFIIFYTKSAIQRYYVIKAENFPA